MSESIYLRSAGPFLYDLKAKKFVSVKDGFVIGRLNGDLTFPDDNRMSRSHAKISLAGAGLREAMIEDLKSTNGMFVNGQKALSGQKIPLSDGGVIEIGDQVFCFTYTQEVPPFSLDEEQGAPSAPRPQGPIVQDAAAGRAPVGAPQASGAPPPPVSAAGQAAAEAFARQALQAEEAASEVIIEAEGSGSLTRKVLKPVRVRPIPQHPITFQRTDGGGGTALRVTDISTSGMGLLRDPLFQWPPRGAQLAGRLVGVGADGAQEGIEVTVEILRKVPLLVGCAFVGNTREVRKFIERYFGIEISACQMDERQADGDAHGFFSDHCELTYRSPGGKLADWRITLFGDRIECDGGRVRLASPVPPGTVVERHLSAVLGCALRLLGNIDSLDEDVRDAMSAAILGQLQGAR